MTRMLTKLAIGVASGLAGALAVTAAHELLRSRTSRSPRMDVLGMRALAKLGDATFGRHPKGKQLRRDALVGDLVANTAWVGLVGAGGKPLPRGVGLGLLAGVGAVVLPPLLGLGRAPRGRSALVKGETVALYLAGGLVAAGAAWVARELEQGRLVEDARAKLDEVRSKINARKSGMIH